ncbi:pyridoxal phosphate-dependent transferase [Aspergillus pseudotamarii]|uniref:Pyridoxal phosphate-dependent transferase n=1 Tax=Aspergillus pseudotamarii TaxID=132259 RepID=A0A5N6SH78_ASPPS|nr:pyridoxal phosphate-dependent transferase [Aspergillus pseudotamarii]KAE8133229.1 pyridoxal phosphate-dependent transferase [Aspergillus pseudotamarii]
MTVTSEPSLPSMQTTVPGPLTNATKSKLDVIFDARTPQMVIDYDKSSGSYLVDIDAAQSPAMISTLVNRPAIGNFPSQQWFNLLRDGPMRAAPPGCTQVFTAQSGSEANELAFKAAFMAYRRKQRGVAPWSEHEQESAMRDQTPGSPDLAILSFENSFHGRGFASLSTTCSKPRCLHEIEHVIDSWHCPVAGIIVEPIQSEGGFGGTGKFWGHERWNLSAPADIVTFSKKAQTAGYFFSDNSLRPDRSYRQFIRKTEWMGDVARVIMCNAVIDEILSENLVEKTARVGEPLHERFATPATRYLDFI